MPSPKPFLEPAVKAATADLRDRLRKALSAMTTTEINDSFINATAFGPNSARFYSGLGKAGLEAWPFGTVLRPIGSIDNRRIIMVLVDKGLPNFTAVVIQTATTQKVGSVRSDWVHNRWEPVEMS